MWDLGGRKDGAAGQITAPPAAEGGGGPSDLGLSLAFSLTAG